MINPRIDKTTELPDFWKWKTFEDKREGLGFDWDWLKKRPLSASSLKNFFESPKHYSNKMLFPRKPGTEDQLLGRAIETLALEKDKFDKQFRVFEKATGTGSRAKNEEALLQAKSDGVMLITPEQLQRSEYAYESLMDHNEARTLIENKIKVQQELRWTDRQTKIPLLGYLDFTSKAWEMDWIVDLKTGPNVEPEIFNKTLFKLFWHIQGATYLEAYKEIYYKFPSFIFLGVETKDPYNISVNFFEDKAAERAKKEFHHGLIAFKKCVEEFRFNEGYEFWLMETRSYFGVRYPGYYKPSYGNID